MLIIPLEPPGPLAGVGEYFPHRSGGWLLRAVFLVRDEENDAREKVEAEKVDEGFTPQEDSPARRVGFFRRGVHAVAQVAKIFRTRKP